MPGKTALQGLFDGKQTGKRKQRIYTPQPVIDRLLKLWGSVECDPCSGPDSIVPARIKVEPPGNGCIYDGRTEPTLERWPARTYVNPPFARLKPWVKQFAESESVVLMTPVRTHRAWWRRDVLYGAHALCWLKPIAFRGFDAMFPAPLALAYRGDSPDDFMETFSDMGDCELRSP